MLSSNVYLPLSYHVLQDTLTSQHLLLRRAAVACLRQLSQREAAEVSEHAMSIQRDAKNQANNSASAPENGLEGQLYGLLDIETDKQLISDTKDTLVSMLQSLADQNLARWLLLIKDVLQASTGKMELLVFLDCNLYEGYPNHWQIQINCKENILLILERL